MLHKCAITLNKITDSSGFEHCWNCWDNVTFLNAWMLLITFSKAFKESYLMLTKTQGYIYIKRRIKTSISTQQHHSLSCGCGILWYNHTRWVFSSQMSSPSISRSCSSNRFQVPLCFFSLYFNWNPVCSFECVKYHLIYIWDF